MRCARAASGSPIATTRLASSSAGSRARTRRRSRTPCAGSSSSSVGGPRAIASRTSPCAAPVAPFACFPSADERASPRSLPLRHPDELPLPLRRRRPPPEQARPRVPNRACPAPAQEPPRDRRAHQAALRAGSGRRSGGRQRLEAHPAVPRSGLWGGDARGPSRLVQVDERPEVADPPVPDATVISPALFPWNRCAGGFSRVPDDRQKSVCACAHLLDRQVSPQNLLVAREGVSDGISAAICAGPRPLLVLDVFDFPIEPLLHQRVALCDGRAAGVGHRLEGATHDRLLAGHAGSISKPEGSAVYNSPR